MLPVGLFSIFLSIENSLFVLVEQLLKKKTMTNSLSSHNFAFDSLPQISKILWKLIDASSIPIQMIFTCKWKTNNLSSAELQRSWGGSDLSSKWGTKAGVWQNSIHNFLLHSFFPVLSIWYIYENICLKFSEEDSGGSSMALKLTFNIQNACSSVWNQEGEMRNR